ncbi:hypothetical protein M569_05110 [Genlisea aurea]|uniref:Uncharacterized protein n=1 Tax=Genlisea aurea TaxID=192259 RepID=S8EAT3_9LAMI|nr:hypothetical protein M569_05110 [Genlisea aurea]
MPIQWKKMWKRTSRTTPRPTERMLHQNMSGHRQQTRSGPGVVTKWHRKCTARIEAWRIRYVQHKNYKTTKVYIIRNMFSKIHIFRTISWTMLTQR